MAELVGMSHSRQVAEVIALKDCFLVRRRRPVAVEVVTAVAAKERMMRGNESALVWLDMTLGALYLAERWGPDIVQQRLPLQFEVDVLPAPVHVNQQECVVATIEFKTRNSLELFATLVLQALPRWSSMRQGVAGRSLLLSHGHWLLREQGQALRIDCCSGSVSGLLRLNPSEACVELSILSQGDSVRQHTVISIPEGIRVLRKHTEADLCQDRTVHQAIHKLYVRPNQACMHKLQTQLQASRDGCSRATSMHAWLAAGVIPALVDCTAFLAASTARQQQKQHQQQSNNCRNHTANFLEAHALLHQLADSICIVLLATQGCGSAQMQLFVACITRSLSADAKQALLAVQLLMLVFRRIADDHCFIKEPLMQACQEAGLWQQLLCWYTWTMPSSANGTVSLGTRQPMAPPPLVHQRSQQTTVGCLSSHPVMLDNAFELELQTTDSLPASCVATCIKSPNPSNSWSTRSIVPRLSMPQGTPPLVLRSSRLSVGSMMTGSTDGPTSTEAPPTTAPSQLAALQQLARSCGNSVMATDLATFVTHRRLHAHQPGSIYHCKHQPQAATTGGTKDGEQEPQALDALQLRSLPVTLQLQLQLLQCMEMLMGQLPAGSPAPVPISNPLASQLLLPRLAVRQHFEAGMQLELCDPGLLDTALQLQRRLALKMLVQYCDAMHLQQQASRSLGQDAAAQGLPCVDGVLAQCRLHLLEHCAVKHPDASVHTACADVLLLLRDYICISSQPRLADTTCEMLGRVLAQLEYMLRSSRVLMWHWGAVQHMDAIVQLYTAIAKKATTPAATDFLLQRMGSQQVADTPKYTIGSDAGNTPGAPGSTVDSPRPADTLQLVLDYMQQRLPSSAGSNYASSWAGTVLSTPVGSEAGAVSLGTMHISTAKTNASIVAPRDRSVLGHANSSGLFTATPCSGSSLDSSRQPLSWYSCSSTANCEGAMTQGNSFKAHCWQLLTCLVQLVARASASSNAGSTSHPSASSSSSRHNTPATASHGRISPLPLLPLHLWQWSPISETTDNGAMAARQTNSNGTAAQQASEQRLQQPQPTVVNRSRTTSVSGLTGTSSGVAGGALTALLQILVDRLLRHKNGRPYLLQQLEELDSNPTNLPLQSELISFLVSALAVPRSHLLTVPQLAEFYVHYHFIHFTRQYYKLSTSFTQAAAAWCKGNLQVLLALILYGGTDELVRRRCTQLKVLDFITHELGLEYILHSKQNCFGASSSYRSSDNASGCASPMQGRTGRYSQRTDRHSSAAGNQNAAGECCIATYDRNTHNTPCGAQLRQLVSAESGTPAAAAAASSYCAILSARGASGDLVLTARGLSGLLQHHVSASCLAPSNRHQGQSVQDDCQPCVACVPPTAGVDVMMQKQQQMSPCRGARHSMHLSQSTPPVLAAVVEPNTQLRKQQHVQSHPLPGSVDATASNVQVQQAGLTKATEVPRLQQGQMLSSAGGVEQGIKQTQLVSISSLQQQQPSSCGNCHAPAVPLPLHTLATGLASGQQQQQPPGNAAAAQGADDPDQCLTGCRSSYRPGFDLEDDFERLMEDDDDSFWACSSGGVDNSDSRSCMSATSADSQAEQREGTGTDCQHALSSPKLAAASTITPAGLSIGPGSMPAVAAAANSGSDGSYHQQCLDALGAQSSDAGPRLRHRCTKLPTLKIQKAATMADTELGGSSAQLNVAHGGNGSSVVRPHDGSDVAASSCSGSGSFAEDVRLLDVIDWQDDDDREQASAMQAPDAAGSTLNRCRSSLVPHLALPVSLTHLQLPLPAAMHTSSSNPSSKRTALSTPARAIHLNLLSAATPLSTTRSALAGRLSRLVAAQQQQRNAAESLPNQQLLSSSGLATEAYYTHRQARAVYHDAGLQLLCLQLALLLMVTPAGMLDPQHVPIESTGPSVQQKVLVMLHHLSHADNADPVQALADSIAPQQQGNGDGASTAGLYLPSRVASASRHNSDAGAPLPGVASGIVAGSGMRNCMLRLLKLLSTHLLEGNRLQLGGLINKGAFSDVHAGTLNHPEGSLQVAVKVVDCKDSSHFERVYNEVAVLQGLQGQQGVVPLLDYGVAAGGGSRDSEQQVAEQPCWLLVFPRYSASLRQWRMIAGQGLQPGLIHSYLQIFLQVANIVQGLHAANVVHYDIKGDNVLLDDSNTVSSSGCQHADASSTSQPGFGVVLADFGDAMFTTDSSSPSAHRYRGTELFSSPEMLLLHAGQQVLGHDQHDRRKHRGVGRAHDVWSLGCMLYELLTGRPLFEEEGVGRILSYIGCKSCPGGRSNAAGRQQLSQSVSIAADGCSSSSVLMAKERAALGDHTDLIELVEFMLVVEPAWRPEAADVVHRVQRLLKTL